MTLCPPLNHEGLLTLARKLEGAVGDGDRDRLATAAQRLSEALVVHVIDERPGCSYRPTRVCCSCAASSASWTLSST